MAGQAWHWAGTHPQENTLKNFPGNKVCSVAGIYFSKRYGKVGIFPVPKQIPYSWLALSFSVGKDFKDDLQILLEGVSEFDVQVLLSHAWGNIVHFAESEKITIIAMFVVVILLVVIYIIYYLSLTSKKMLYVFGSVGVVLLNSVTLMTELILKAVNGERALGDLRVVFSSSESLLVFSLLILLLFEPLVLVLMNSTGLMTELILQAVNGERTVEDLRMVVFPSECLFILNGCRNIHFLMKQKKNKDEKYRHKYNPEKTEDFCEMDHLPAFDGEASPAKDGVC
ncbi:TRPM8 channel-associated factor-like protein [Labeo rohita]|uniref:TRPM8 channel-associated factor-like protein n=1 Tax=Labeo rohita TaxID=84645 RepID=A0A498M1C1_LABRO|nr:TRPM8 channel-associated factor-like protein [Labeo rohita]